VGTRNPAARQFSIDVFAVFFKLFQNLPLSPVVLELLQPANSHVVFLIIDQSFPFPIISFQSHINFTNYGKGFKEKRAGWYG
jgi:hypothetical protein